MMEQKDLEDYISTLSEREKEEHKHLIRECRERQSTIQRDCNGLRDNLLALCCSLNSGIKIIQALRRASNILTGAGPFAELGNRGSSQHYPESLN